MRRQRTRLLAEVVERVANLVRLVPSRWFGWTGDARRSHRVGRRRAAPLTWRGTARARPTWRCPGPNERERAFWARLFARWKVDEPSPDFTERLVAGVIASLRARCPARRAEAVGLPDGFTPKTCYAGSTGTCPVQESAMAAPPSSRVRPVLRTIHGGKATPCGARDAASKGAARASDDEAPPSKPAA